MTTANLKIDLINKITLVKESYVIDEINRILDFELEKGIFKLNANPTLIIKQKKNAIFK